MAKSCLLAWKTAKKAPFTPDSPTHQAGACRASLHGLCLQSTPTTNPAPQVFPMSKREVPLSPGVALLARDCGARFDKKEAGDDNL